MDVDALDKGAGKGKSKGKGKKSNAENSNWQKSWKGKGDEHSDGWKTTDWQTKRGSKWWTTANDWTSWETEEPMGGIDITAINSMETCSNNLSKKSRRAKTTKEKTTSDEPHANRTESGGTTKITPRHKDLHGRPRL